MQTFKKTLLILFFGTVVVAQSPEPPIADSRLTIHTLVREDIFAGFLTDDMERLARGEKNVELLLEKRPAAKAELLSWKGGATLYRAVRAHESNKSEEFNQLYSKANSLFAEAREISPGNGGVAAVTGGSFVVFGDRLPKEHRAPAWSQAYEAFQILWKQQGSIVDKLPLHIKGELLGGLAQSAMRTGRTEEAGKYLDKILEVLSDSPYASVARQWKANPKAANDSGITCLSCHDSGRLTARLTAIGAK